MWYGQIVSLLGDWFNLIASAILVARLTGVSGQAIGTLFVVRMLAPFLVGPFGGVAADRFDRRTLLVASDIARALVALGFLAVRDPRDVVLLYGLSALQLGLSGVFFPARDALLPELVSSRELGAANALTSATWSVMLALGAALGGIVAGRFGIYQAFVVDAATFVASAVILWGLGGRPARAAGAAMSGPRVIRDYLEGLAYLARHKTILAVVLNKAAVAVTVSGTFAVLQVALAEDVYSAAGSAVALSWMYAVVGLGTGIGPIVARRFTGDRHRPLLGAIAAAYIVAGAGIAMVAPLPWLPIALIGFALRGVGGGVVWVFSTHLLLEVVPREVRGRVFGTDFALFTLANAMGAWTTGLALDHGGLSPEHAIAIVSVAIMMPGLAWGLWLARRPGAPVGPPVPVAPAPGPSWHEESAVVAPGLEGGMPAEAADPVPGPPAQPRG